MGLEPDLLPPKRFLQISLVVSIITALPFHDYSKHEAVGLRQSQGIASFAGANYLVATSFTEANRAVP